MLENQTFFFYQLCFSCDQWQVTAWQHYHFTFCWTHQKTFITKQCYVQTLTLLWWISGLKRYGGKLLRGMKCLSGQYNFAAPVVWTLHKRFTKSNGFFVREMICHSSFYISYCILLYIGTTSEIHILHVYICFWLHQSMIRMIDQEGVQCINRRES